MPSWCAPPACAGSRGEALGQHGAKQCRLHVALEGGIEEVAVRRLPGQIQNGRLGQLPGEFAAVIEKAKPDSLVDEPVKSSFGWHVIRLAAIREQPAPSFEESRDKLADLVNNQRLQSYVSKLRSEAKIGTPQ